MAGGVVNIYIWKKVSAALELFANMVAMFYLCW